MTYDQNSFLQGIAVGKSLKGWSSGLGTSVPTCYNDEGVYTYFYIDYHLPISAISLTLFNLATRVICESGELEVTAIESVSSTTFKVTCDISSAKASWIAINGYNSAWLTYDSGYSVPEYSTIFYVDGMTSYTPGYVKDTGSYEARSYDNSSETYAMYIYEGTTYPYDDEMEMTAAEYGTDETFTITYS